MKTILVTGSSGLIGSEVCAYFAELGYAVHGVDNNQRVVFFGPDGDTMKNQHRLEKKFPFPLFQNHCLDVRDRRTILDLVGHIRPSVIVHAAAQPSHDVAAEIPFANFDINAVGTVNLLEAAKQFCIGSPFIFLSTNKVYGGHPHVLPLDESSLRFDFVYPEHAGISEKYSIDQSLHSLFGASKVAADVMVQEYGRYYEMPTCCLRAGCLTGPNHSGVELHGFLNYLVRCNVEGRGYRVFGYKGKQVRDNLHSYDVATFIHEFVKAPRCGEVYNLGGGKENSCSILEAFALTENATGKRQKYRLNDAPRIGDHACYYSDLSKIKKHYPQWKITRSLKSIVVEMADHFMAAR
jgi:CDP-paratose 2-epimerase